MTKYTAITLPKYETDDIANNFPMATYDELDMLKMDILDKRRVINNIVIYKGKILDGRNRYLALNEIFEENEEKSPEERINNLEIEVTFEDYDINNEKTLDEVKMYADSLNLIRRHLTASQKAGLSLVLYRKEFEKIKAEKGVNSGTGVELKGKEKSKTVEEFGTKVGVNSAYITKAYAVLQADEVVGTKVLKHVYNGYLDINQAPALMKLPIEKRDKALANLDAKIAEIKLQETTGASKDKNVRKNKLIAGTEAIKNELGRTSTKKNYLTDDRDKIALYIPFEIDEKTVSKIAETLYNNIFYDKLGDDQQFNIAVIKNANSEKFIDFKNDVKNIKVYDGLKIKDKYAVQGANDGDNSQA